MSPDDASPHSPTFPQEMSANGGFFFSEHFSPTSTSGRCLPLWRTRKQARTCDPRLLKCLKVLQQGSRLGTALSSSLHFASAFWSLQRDVEAWPLRYSTCWVSLSGRGTLSGGLWAWGSGAAFSKTTLREGSSSSQRRHGHQIPSELPNSK